MPGRTPWHGARRTPLPGVEKGSHLRVVPDSYRREDRHVGLEDAVRRHPSTGLHAECIRNYYDDQHGFVCGPCAWTLGLDTDAARYVDAHIDEED